MIQKHSSCIVQDECFFLLIMLPLKGGRRRTTEHADEAFLHLLDTF